MTKDQRTLLAALAAQAHVTDFPARRMPGEVAVGLGFSQRRALTVLGALAALGFYDYDISLYTGRLTAAGLEAARRVTPS